MIKLFTLVTLCISPSLQDFVNISGQAKLVNPTHYMAKVVQETFSEVEEIGFCNLKLRDFNQTLNEFLHNWHVVGHVEYTNGFLFTMDRIRVFSISGSISTFANTDVTIASFTASVELFAVVVGYDVVAHLGSDGTHIFTGTFRHSSIRYTFRLSKNMNTDEITLTYTVDSVSGGSGVRMVYMPESRVSEVLSRRFLSSSSLNSASAWARDIFVPIMLEKAKKIDFPKIIFEK